MSMHRTMLATLLGATSCAVFAQADPGATMRPPIYDADAPVFIVTSQDTWRGLGAGVARNALDRLDGTGSPVVVVEVKEYQLGQFSQHVHERELRCGGYFAFATREDAEAFLADDRSAAAASPLRVAADYTIDNAATVQPWLSSVDATRIRATIAQLSSYRNRYYASADGKAAAESIRTTWAGLASARADADAALYAGCTNCSTQPSVILTVQGSELPGEVVVLGAHLDSINVSASGSLTQTAPGADDDASGVATLTEVIRVALATGWKPKRTVKFMAYAAEETGLRGSNAIAQSFKAAGTNVVGVLQLDMTNYKSGNVEDMQLITDYSNAALQTFLTNLFDRYLAPLGLTRGTYTCGYGCSDHASWTSAGYPSGMMFEAGTTSGYNPYIHSANDTLANMGDSAVNSAKFARLGLAFLGELAKTGGSTPPANQPPTANFSVVANGLTASFTDTSGDSDGIIAARAWTFGDGGTSTSTNPSRTYAAAGTYNVALTVTDDDGASNTKTVPVTVTAGGAQTYANTADYAIRDDATVDSPIAVSGRTGNAPGNASVTVAIVHTYIGDLKVDLVAPDGTLYNIHNRTGSDTDNINKTVTLNLSSEALNGTWKLRVNDNGPGDTGKIDSWSIRF